jgi:4-aminobutyrate aminotransferase-like enzyme
VSGELESIAGTVPGAHSTELLSTLRRYESQNVTACFDDFPVVWESALGALVTDVDGNRYIDLTAAFGVANAGHANPYVVSAVADQASRIMHGMGDVHPTQARIELLERLASIVPQGLSKAILATTGSEAVEAALKTAMLVTGRSRFAAYRGAYHGLSFGALAICGIEKFREPFVRALAENPVLLEYPRNAAGIGVERLVASARDALAQNGDVAALMIEPIQGRGGCIVPPPGYLAAIAGACKELGIVLVVDEIYTGFGRTGAWFAVEHDRIVPDILCIGKAMGSGFPISAAIGRAEIMDAWPLSKGEALHTSTYLGNPMACAAALATISEHERLGLAARSRQLGLGLGSRLDALRAHRNVVDVRGRGMLWGVHVKDAPTADAIVKRALASGVIVVQSGPEGDVLAISPPLTIGERQLYRAVEILEAAIRAVV